MHSADEILQVIQQPSMGPIPAEKVRVWMDSEELQIMGVGAYVVSNAHINDRVVPPLDSSRVHAFLRRLYARSIKEDPSGDWTYSRYTAGWSWMHLIQQCVSTSNLRELAKHKSELERLYREGNEQVRECLVVSILEHLFEDPKAIELFSDWSSDLELNEPYTEALGYAQEIREHTD